MEKPKRDLTAFFAEFAFPIFGDGNARPGLHSLLLNVQARYDRYEATGAFGGVTRVRESGTWVHVGEPNIVTLTHTHTSPRIGLRYEPTENLVFRASWAESFRPPVFSDTFHIVEPREDTVYVQDPYDVPGGPTCLAFGCAVRRATIYGVGDDLNPEIADNYSMSIDWTPEAVPGLHWTVHWSRVDFTDKIEYSYNLLFSEPEVAFTLPEIIERDADGNAIRAFARYINLSGKVSEILTTELEYSFVNDFGAFRPRLSYTRVLEEHFTILPGAEPVNRVGTTWGSNEYGLVGSVEWTSGKYGADLFVRYTPSYENDRTGTCLVLVGRCERLYGPRPSMTVDSYTTVDLTASYRFENGLRLRGGGRNVLDADPPATPWGDVPYDLTRYDARGQVLFMEADWTKTWISNGIEGSCFALLVKTDPEVRPRHRGMSLFLAEKANGLSVGRKLGKLGYKGIDSAELVFENYQVSEDNLIGGEEGQGFYQTVGGLELGRINVAARGVGIANAALKEATSYSQVRETMGKPICEHQAIQTRSMSSQLQPVRKHPTRSNLVSPAGLGNDEGIAALSVSVIERC